MLNTRIRASKSVIKCAWLLYILHNGENEVGPDSIKLPSTLQPQCRWRGHPVMSPVARVVCVTPGGPAGIFSYLHRWAVHLPWRPVLLGNRHRDTKPSRPATITSWVLSVRDALKGVVQQLSLDSSYGGSWGFA